MKFLILNINLLLINFLKNFKKIDLKPPEPKQETEEDLNGEEVNNEENIGGGYNEEVIHTEIDLEK